MIAVPEVTLATHTARPVTAVLQGAQMRTRVLDPVTARYLVYPNNAPLLRAQVIFLSFSLMFVHIKRLELL